ncbi:MAG TPA: 50S ribosomal protein L24 [Pyrinomonadaceae bacterium]|jgi:large subunit ribosomal protein L24
MAQQQRQGAKRAKIRKGDQVVVIAGRDNGKRGRVLEVKPSEGRVKVEGVAVVKKHQKANPGANRGGGIIDREAFIDISNVQLLDPQTGRPTRVRYEVEGDGTKRRVAGSGASLEK